LAKSKPAWFSALLLAAQRSDPSIEWMYSPVVSMVAAPIPE